MIDNFKENLLNIRKRLEKRLIQSFVAHQSYTKSENRDQMVKHTKEAKTEGFKNTGSNYIGRFKASAKGTWVKKATESFNQNLKKVDTV